MLAVLLLGLASYNAGGFAAGALLWEGRRALAWTGRLGWWGGAVLFALGAVLGGMPYDTVGTPYWPAYVWASGWLADPMLAAHRAGAMLIVVAALAWPPLHWLLVRPAFQALGRVSFMVYLCHVIVLCSLGSGLVLLLTPAWGYDAATAAALVATLAATLAVAAAMTRLVDAPATVMSRWAERAALAAALPGRVASRRSA